MEKATSPPRRFFLIEGAPDPVTRLGEIVAQLCDDRIPDDVRTLAHRALFARRSDNATEARETAEAMLTAAQHGSSNLEGVVASGMAAMFLWELISREPDTVDLRDLDKLSAAQLQALAATLLARLRS